MLAVKQRPDQPLVIGDVIVYVRPDGADVHVSIDAPRSVNIRRGDLVEQDLDRAGYKRVGPDRWQSYRGPILTTRQALAVVGALG